VEDKDVGTDKDIFRELRIAHAILDYFTIYFEVKETSELLDPGAVLLQAGKMNKSLIGAKEGKHGRNQSFRLKDTSIRFTPKAKLDSKANVRSGDGLGSLNSSWIRQSQATIPLRYGKVMVAGKSGVVSISRTGKVRQARKPKVKLFLDNEENEEGTPSII